LEEVERGGEGGLGERVGLTFALALGLVLLMVFLFMEDTAFW
jgi:hypothetical protein